jgi:uncharacterized coiled-coil protein SlyX
MGRANLSTDHGALTAPPADSLPHARTRDVVMTERREPAVLRWWPVVALLAAIIGQGFLEYARLDTIADAVRRHEASLARIEDGTAVSMRAIVERIQNDEKHADEALNAMQSRFSGDNAAIAGLNTQLQVLVTKTDLERESMKLLGDRVGSLMESRVVRK